MKEKKETQIENVGRRKAVKTIVGGVTALAAYNVLPVKWGTPIIEQVFLPAHAATSGLAINSCSIESRLSFAGAPSRGYDVRYTVGVLPATDGIQLIINETATRADGTVEQIQITNSSTVTDSSGSWVSPWSHTHYADNPTVSITIEVTATQASGSSSCSWTRPLDGGS